MPFLKKVCFLKDGRIKMEYDMIADNEESPDEISRKYSSAPAESFEKAVEALVPHFLSIVELPKDEVDKIELSEFTFTKTGENEVLGFVISGSRNLANSHVNLALKTPLKLTEKANDNIEPNQICSKKCAEAVQKFIEECLLFIDGKKLQVDSEVDK